MTDKPKQPGQEDESADTAMSKGEAGAFIDGLIQREILALTGATEVPVEPEPTPPPSIPPATMAVSKAEASNNNSAEFQDWEDKIKKCLEIRAAKDRGVISEPKPTPSAEPTPPPSTPPATMAVTTAEVDNNKPAEFQDWLDNANAQEKVFLEALWEKIKEDSQATTLVADAKRFLDMNLLREVDVEATKLQNDIKERLAYFAKREKGYPSYIKRFINFLNNNKDKITKYLEIKTDEDRKTIPEPKPSPSADTTSPPSTPPTTMAVTTAEVDNNKSAEFLDWYNEADVQTQKLLDAVWNYIKEDQKNDERRLFNNVIRIRNANFEGQPVLQKLQKKIQLRLNTVAKAIEKRPENSDTFVCSLFENCLKRMQEDIKHAITKILGDIIRRKININGLPEVKKRLERYMQIEAIRGYIAETIGKKDVTTKEVEELLTGFNIINFSYTYSAYKSGNLSTGNVGQSFVDALLTKYKSAPASKKALWWRNLTSADNSDATQADILKSLEDVHKSDDYMLEIETLYTNMKVLFLCREILKKYLDMNNANECIEQAYIISEKISKAEKDCRDLNQRIEQKRASDLKENLEADMSDALISLESMDTVDALMGDDYAELKARFAKLEDETS